MIIINRVGIEIIGEMGSHLGLIVFCALFWLNALKVKGQQWVLLTTASSYATPDTHGIGGCGYGKKVAEQGETAALNSSLFNNGATCGACFELLCSPYQPRCREGSMPIRVTASDHCKPRTTGSQFCVSQPLLDKFADDNGGTVKVFYRRVSCWRSSGIKFEIGGNAFWTTVLVYNVGGAGDVKSLSVKGSSSSSSSSSSSRWTPMIRNWGQKWTTFKKLNGQRLSFQVTTSDGVMVQVFDVVPNDWQIGRSYEGSSNFGGGLGIDA